MVANYFSKEITPFKGSTLAVRLKRSITLLADNNGCFESQYLQGIGNYYELFLNTVLIWIKNEYIQFTLVL